MNVQIITIHAMHNPGSVLQAYALQTYISSFGHNVKIIDYRPNYFYTENSWCKLIIKKIVYLKWYYNRNKKFNTFISNNLHLSRLYKTFEELEDEQIECDILIAGSDQLWNTDFDCGNDPAFYLKFTKQPLKISYSTSIGKSAFSKPDIDWYKNNLRDFNHISVREKNASEWLSKVLGRTVAWVCDPVFLLDAKQYYKYIGVRPSAKKYVMVYLSPKSKQLDEIVRYYHREGYDIILVGGFTKRCYCDKHIRDAGPMDFLTYIYYADIVISTSFHATAFCHILHRPFVSIIPQKNGERILSLLEKTGLTYKAVSEEPVAVDDLKRHIDWEMVDYRLKDYIAVSESYLEESLNKKC